MASCPKRRVSKELPPNFCDLMNKLLEHTDSFIQQFDSRKPKMREIVEEFLQLSREIKEMQEKTDNTRIAGAVVGGVGLGISIFLAPFTAGLSLAGGVVAAAGGGAKVAEANITKIMSEKGGAEKVEKWGRAFIALVEPMKKNLDMIKTTCESLEEEAAEAQAKHTQADTEEFQRILRRVSELKEKSEGVLIESFSVVDVLKEIVMFILTVMSITPTPKEDKKLRDAIIRSADQCQKVVNEFNEMKNQLREFRGH